MIEELTRLTPADLDSEEAVLGSILIDPEAIFKIAASLKPEDFFREKNRWTYEACLARKGEGINQLTVAHELARVGKLEAAGGAAYLSHLVSQVPTSVHVEHYAKIVADFATKRRLITVANQIAESAYNPNVTPDEAVDKARMAIERLGSIDDSKDAMLFSDEAWLSYPEHLAARAQDKNKKRLTMGWGRFDNLVKMRNGTLTIVAGQPGYGKTIIAEHIYERALEEGLNAALFHNELLNRQFQNREACRYVQMADEDGHKRTPRFTEFEDGCYHDHEAIFELQEKMLAREGKGVWVECAGWHMSKICGMIYKLAHKGYADVIILDYLQCVPLDDLTGRSGQNMAQAIGTACQMLKDTSLRLPNQPPVILMSQLNYDGEARNSGEPKEKGNVYIKIGAPWRESKEKCLTGCPMGKEAICKHHCIKAVVEKNTFGPTGQFDLWHDPPRFRFYEGKCEE